MIEAENLFVVDQLHVEGSQIELAKGVAYASYALEAGNGNGGPPMPGSDGTTEAFGWNQPTAELLDDVRRHAADRSRARHDARRRRRHVRYGDSGRPNVRRLEGDPLDPPEVGPPEIPDKLLRAGRAGYWRDRQLSLDDQLRRPPGKVPPIDPKPWQLLDSSLAFCIPDNKELRAYWDRVEGRLFNIRNCRDIEGTRRLPELFGPEIDPRLLIKLKAAGLTLDDVLNVTSGNVPPYRFTYLLEKARQYASTVESMGGALLSALEKRDAETLANLRTTHEQHLLKMRTQLQNHEISAAEQARDGLTLQQQAAEYRRDYYRGLSQTGLSGWERTQQVTRHIVTGLHEIEAVVQLVRAVLSLVPELGAPTAMKYGGIATSGAASGFASASQALAQAAEAASGSAGLEATFQRRDDDWKQQAALAQREVDQLKKQVAAAEFRIQIAERSLEVHSETLEQTEELYQFSKDRFTSLGLYTFLSTTLQRLYREAFNSALSMAVLAEQSYRFERPADTTTLLQRNYWDPSSGGLLAGERLLLDLQALERRYLETDYRELEIEQSFSLAQYDPAALAALREVGKCSFKVPELFFDLAVPGALPASDQGGPPVAPVRRRPVRECECDAEAARQRASPGADREPDPRAAAPLDLDRRKQRPERRGRVRVQLPGRALHAVRGQRRGQHLAALAPQGVSPVRLRDDQRRRAADQLHGRGGRDAAADGRRRARAGGTVAGATPQGRRVAAAPEPAEGPAGRLAQARHDSRGE